MDLQLSAAGGVDGSFCFSGVATGEVAEAILLSEVSIELQTADLPSLKHLASISSYIVSISNILTIICEKLRLRTIRLMKVF